MAGALIIAPETRAFTANASGDVLGLHLVCKGIAYDAGTADALKVYLTNNQWFLLKKGYSERNDIPMSIARIQAGDLDLTTGAFTVQANANGLYSFGDSLPTLGPTDVQTGGVPVAPSVPLPVAAEQLNASAASLGRTVPVAVVSGGAAVNLATSTFMISQGLGLAAASFRGLVTGPTGMVPTLKGWQLPIQFSNAAAGGASVLRLTFVTFAGVLNPAWYMSFTALPAVAGLYTLVLSAVEGQRDVTANIYTRTANGIASATPIQTLVLPNVMPCADFGLFLAVTSGDDISLTAYGIVAELGA